MLAQEQQPHRAGPLAFSAGEAVAMELPAIAAAGRREGESLFAPQEIRRILVCRPNHRLGNLLFLTPALAELEARFPSATVDILAAGDGARTLFSGFRNVRSIFELPRNGFHAPGRFARTVRSVWRERYDLVIDPEHRSRSARFLADRCRARYRLGFTGAGNTRLTHGAPISDSPRHMALRPVYLLRSGAGAAGVEPKELPSELDLRLHPGERLGGARLLQRLFSRNGASAQKPIISLFLNATKNKRYPTSWWIELTSRLRERLPHARLLEILPADAAPQSQLGIQTFQSDDLRGVAAVISHTSMFVSADCGLMHLACAARGPTVVGLFSVTDPAVHGPCGPAHRAVVTSGSTSGAIADHIADAFLGLAEQSAPKAG